MPFERLVLIAKSMAGAVYGKEGKGFSVKPKNSNPEPVRQSPRRLGLSGSQNFTPCVSSSGTWAAGGRQLPGTGGI